MKCYACGGKYIDHKGELNLQNEFIGNYVVSLEKYYKCENCGTLLFPKDTVKKIEAAEKEKRNKLIRKLPLDDFIMAKKAADILGISKQALSKNRRIKNGFIYSAIVGEKKLYNKKSVQLFKERGDGRFNLSIQVTEEFSKYVFVIGGSSIPIHNPYINRVGEFPKPIWKTTVKTHSPKLYH